MNTHFEKQTELVFSRANDNMNKTKLLVASLILGSTIAAATKSSDITWTESKNLTIVYVKPGEMLKLTNQLALKWEHTLIPLIPEKYWQQLTNAYHDHLLTNQTLSFWTNN